MLFATLSTHGQGARIKLGERPRKEMSVSYTVDRLGEINRASFISHTCPCMKLKCTIEFALLLHELWGTGEF